MLFVHSQHARIGAQKPTYEDVRGELVVVVALELLQNADWDTGSLSEFGDRDLPGLPFPLEIASQ
jgi:hypothetical protein